MSIEEIKDVLRSASNMVSGLAFENIFPIENALGD